MDGDAKICRLCLKIIGKDVPYSPLTNNNSVLHNLNLISFVTIKNLQLTENPVICDLCDNKLKKLAYFKENIITNEFQIQCNQKKDSNSFLEAVSKDFDTVCRLCLKASENSTELQTSWKDIKIMFIKCNIHLNLNIPKPSKICRGCDTMLQNMWNLVIDCSENEKQIVELASKKGNLSFKDLLKISSGKAKISAKSDNNEEDNNNVSQTQKNQSEESSTSSKNIVGELKKMSSSDAKDDNTINDEEVKIARTKSEKGKEKAKSTSKVTIAGNVEVELNYLEESMLDLDLKTDNKQSNTYLILSSKNGENSVPSDTESLLLKRTPKTYSRTKPKVPHNTRVVAPTSKPNILSNICLKKQSKPSTSKLTKNEMIIEPTTNDFPENFSEFAENSSIDVSHVTNVADITLDITLGSNVVVKSGSEEEESNDITHELIELLKQTEALITKDTKECDVASNKQYKNTEELLKVLEGDGDDIKFDIEVPIKPELKKGQLKSKKIEPPLKTSASVVANSPVVKTAAKGNAATIVQEGNEILTGKRHGLEKTNNDKSLKSKSMKTLVVKKIVPIKQEKIKSASKISVKGNDGSGTPKKHNLRQKTIMVSFRDMLNMKPLKKKVSESTDNLTEDVAQTYNTNEVIQVQEIFLEDGNIKKEPRTQIKRVDNKISPKPSKKTSKSKLQAVKETSVVTTEELPNTATVSQIEKVNFEKILIQEMTLIDENPQIETEVSIKKEPIKRLGRNKIGGQVKDVSPKKTKKITEFNGFNSEKTVTNNQQEVEKPTTSKASEESQNIATATEVQEVRGDAEKKRGKRKNTSENQKEVPKKRARKSPHKNLPLYSEVLDKNNKNANEEDVKKVLPKKRQARESKQISSPTETNTNVQTEANREVASENSQDSVASDSDDYEKVIPAPDKPVTVTIIRRKKTKNKAQRDKTWMELTGKPVDLVDNKVGLEENDTKIKKRRGRPPLPGTQKKPKKPKPIYYLCDSCPFKSISQNIIVQHQYIHNVMDKALQFKCNQCSFGATTEELLEQHKTTHLTLDVLYKCMFCEYMHKKKNSAMYHTLRHEDQDIANMFYCLVLNQITDEEQYECFQCDYQNVEEAVMPDHVMDHQVEKIKNPILTKFSCKKCFYKTKFEDLFKRHQEMHAEDNKKGDKVIKKELKKEPEEVSPQAQEDQDKDVEVVTVYSCDLCGYLTYNKRSLSNHKGLKHTRYTHPKSNEKSKKRDPLPDEIYRCNECSYTTPKKPHLSRHVVVHRSKENMEFFECMHCIFETKHRRSYKRHMEIKHKVIV